MTSLPKKSIKIDLMRTSLLVVFMKDLTEIMNLRTILDAALPKMAGMNILLVTAGIDPNKLRQRVGILSQLVNNKKLAKIYQCPIELPSNDNFLQHMRQRRVSLNVVDFSKYLEFHLAEDLTQAL